MAAEPTEEQILTITTILEDLNVQMVAISKVILEVQTLVIKQNGKKFDLKTMVVEIISVEQSTYGEIKNSTPTVVVEETATSTETLSASEIQTKLETQVTELKLVLEHCFGS